MGSGTKVHVLFTMKELYSSYIVHSHSLEFSHVKGVSRLKVNNSFPSTSLFIISSTMTFLLETTWKQARNESFKVNEMEQLY
jgi:hypothetical protein